MRLLHFDHLSIHWDQSTMRTHGDGSRSVQGIGAHVGTYTYHDDQGRPFVELVPAETLFDARSLKSAAGTTLTIRHGPGLVTPDRYREEAHGTWVRSWDAGGGNLGVEVRIKSQEGLDFLDAALAKGDPVELSPVYEVDVVGPPGETEHGRHDAIQSAPREYSGIAMLGPDEARGGPEMRLKLDGATQAPAGARVQVRSPRLDSAPRVPLHSAPTGCSKMKHAIISSKGRRRSVALDTLASIRSHRVDATNADQIAVGRVLVEIEGEEPVDLMLPVAMIEMLLEGIGAGPAEAPAEETAPAEEVALEAADADDDEEKLDARAVRKMIADALGDRDRKTQADSARRASIHGDALALLPPGYDYSADWTQVCVDGITRADPEAETRAKALAAKAVNGDSVAEGMLRQMLSERAAMVAPGGSTAIVTVDAGSEAWMGETMPPRSDS